MYFCDEQLRFLLQTASNKYPCDEGHWELWLKVTFRGRPSSSTGNKQQVIDPVLPFAIYERNMLDFSLSKPHGLGASNVLHVLNDFLFTANTKEKCDLA